MRVGISLDSLDEKEHNRFRGHPDAWAMTMAGIENCRRGGLGFQIHTTVTRRNKDELLTITDWCVAHGAKGHHVFFLVPTGRGKDIENTTLRTDEYEEVLTSLMRKQKEVPLEIKPTCAPQFMRIAREEGIPLRYRRGCLAGISYCIIFENFRHKKPRGSCGVCKYYTVCGGCRARAYYYNDGDYMAEEPWCKFSHYKE